MDPRQEFKDTINLLANLTEAYTAALFLRDYSGSNLRAAVWHTLSRSFRSQAIIREGEGVVGYVAKHNQPVDVDRYHQSSHATRYYDEDEGIQAFVAVPVGEIGVLVVDTKNRQIFSEREKKIIRDFSIFFNNLVIHQNTCLREAKYGRILDLLYEVENAALGFRDHRQYYSEILDAGRRYIGLSIGFLFLLHPERKQFTVEAVKGSSLNTLQGRAFPITQGLIGWILREGRALTHSRINPLPSKSYLISPDELLRGYNALVGVPLLAWRKLTGAWAFIGNTERKIDKEEERTLHLAGQWVAATIKHYHLSEL